MEKPDILILDEPTNSLDSSGVSLVKTIIAKERERGAIIILACHDLPLCFKTFPMRSFFWNRENNSTFV